MGIYGSVVIFAKKPQPHPRSELEAIARRALLAFEEGGMMRGGASASAKAERTATFATACVLEEPPAGLDWVEITVEPAALLPALSDLVFTQSEAETDPRGRKGVLTLPYLKATVLSAPILLRDHDGEEVCDSWCLIEFDYEDCRLSEEIHRIRDDSHPLLRRIEQVMGCEVGWGVVSG